MRVIFMGTPDFAVGTLEAILAAGHEVVLTVTQPDKPKGRGKIMQASPVKVCAQKHGIAIYQPKKIREKECIEYLRGFAPDIMIVSAFGQILPKEILEMPRYGCVNVHASLLPKYRGAAPIQWAVINGDAISGVTTMRMDEGLDTGDMIEQTEVVLAADETGGSLFDRLAETGAELCVRTLEEIAKGTAKYTPQNHEEATHTSMIRKQLGEIDWKKPARELECLIRGLNPWPSAYTFLDGKTLKIWKAEVRDNEQEEAIESGNASVTGEALEPGTIIRVMKDAIEVQTGQGILILKELQLEGKKRLSADAFLRGFSVEAGKKLGK